MKKLKDIIYDFNDVLVALLIVAIAGGVIFWRVNAVMAYPKYLAEKMATASDIDIDFAEVDLQQEDVVNMEDPGVDPGTEDESDPVSDPKVPDEQVPETQPEKDPEVSPKPQLTEVEFEVKKGAVWGKVAKELKEQGLILDTKEFTARVTERKLEMKLQIGTFKLNIGMTVDEIIDTLVK